MLLVRVAECVPRSAALMGVQIVVLIRPVGDHTSSCVPSFEGGVAMVSVAGASVTIGFARVGWLLQIDGGLLVTTRPLPILRRVCLCHLRLHNSYHWAKESLACHGRECCHPQTVCEEFGGSRDGTDVGVVWE